MTARVRISCVCLCLVWTALDSQAGEWTRFRGPNGSGSNGSQGPPSEWTEDDINWRIDLPGVGHSSPVIWEDRIFLTSGDEETGERIVSCLDAASGDEVWSRSFPAGQHGKHKLNSFASPTPVLDAERVYIAWGTPEEIVVLALSHEGEEQWRTDLGPFQSGHGFGVSPILVDDILILPVEHQADSFRAAINCSDGSLRWNVPCESSLHYATPCERTGPDGRRELIFVNWEQGISGVSPEDGRVLWSADVFDKEHYESSIASPVLAGDLVIGVSGYLGRGNEVIAVAPGSEPPEPVWRLERGGPLCVTPVVADDLVIFWSDNGIVTCVDSRDGTVHWQERIGGSYYSSPVLAGGRIFNVSTEGIVVVIAADTEFRVLAENDIGEGSHATPAIVGDVMYLRTFHSLLSVGTRE